MWTVHVDKLLVCLRGDKSSRENKESAESTNIGLRTVQRIIKNQGWGGGGSIVFEEEMWSIKKSGMIVFGNYINDLVVMVEKQLGSNSRAALRNPIISDIIRIKASIGREP